METTVRDLHEMSLRSRKASYDLSAASLTARNQALLALARVLEERYDEIQSANGEDLRAAEQDHLASPLMHRLVFDRKKLDHVADGLRALAALPDPLGKTTYAMEITEGLSVFRVVCPIGVIGVIFESRPDALIQISSLCIKSGNAVLLKGGREAIRTNRILCDCVCAALKEAGLPSDAAQLLELFPAAPASLSAISWTTAASRCSAIPTASAMSISTNSPNSPLP